MNFVRSLTFFIVAVGLCSANPLEQPNDGRCSDLKAIKDHYDTQLGRMENLLIEIKSEVAALRGRLVEKKSDGADRQCKDMGANSTCHQFSPSSCCCVVRLEKKLEEAREYCEQHGMALLSIENEEKWSKVVDLLRAAKGDRESYELSLWTSGWDAELTGNWTWTATGQPVTFTNWKPGLPNNRDRSNHALMIRKEEPFYWWDVRTVNKETGLVYVQYFLCES